MSAQGPGHRRVAGRTGHLSPLGVAAMRKLFFALFAMLFMAGLVIAAEELTVSKYDDSTRTVTGKVGDKEVSYKLAKDVKVTVTMKDKDGNASEKEGKVEDLEKRLKAVKADSKFPTKLTVDVKDGEITTVKYRGFGGKGKN